MDNIKTYFKSTGENLFCDDYLYQEALRNNPNSFLQKLDDLFDWEKYTGKALKLYKAKGTLGAPAYRPTILLKSLFLGYLFNVSDREVERHINDSISMKKFLGLSLAEAAPDHSSLSVFRSRILKKGKFDLLHEIFVDIIATAQEKGVKFGKVQVIDSTDTNADVNRYKDKKRQKSKKDGGDGKPPRDPDAKTGVKGTKKIKAHNGKIVQIPKYIYGYKSHLSVNNEYGLITSLHVTNASKYDGHCFQGLMEHDLKIGVAEPHKTIYTADKGYDDGENNAWLNQHKLKDAIFYKGMGKIKEGKVKFTTYTSQEDFQQGVSQRYIVERTNGCLKTHGGLGRARYLGLAKMKIQTYFSSIVFNLKTLVKVLFGIGLRSTATF